MLLLMTAAVEVILPTKTSAEGLLSKLSKRGPMSLAHHASLEHRNAP